MKRVIVDFGIEDIVILKIEQHGKEIDVLSCDSLNSSKYLNDSGTFDVKQISSEIKAKLGKDSALDIDVILPDYMSKCQYVDTEKVEKSKTSDKEQYNGKMMDKQISFVGDNGTDSISQVIMFNKQSLKGFIKEMYKEKLNVISAISRYSAYQYTMPIFQDSGDTSHKNHLFIQVGSHNISCIVMIGNLPVYIKNSGFNLYELYQNIKEQDSRLKYSEFIQAFKESYPYQNFDVHNPVAYVSEAGTSEDAEIERKMREMLMDDSIYEDNSNEVNEDKIDKEISGRVSKEVQTFFEMVCQDAKEVIDYINDQYGSQNIEICTNSKVASKFINSQLSSIYRVNDNYELRDSIEIGDTTINLAELKNTNVNVIASMGDIISGIKKGADFYA